MSWGWWRRHDGSEQRRRLRVLYALGEEMFSMATPAEMAKKLESRLAGIAEAGGVRIYLHNRALETLDPVAGNGRPIQVKAESDERGAAVATCFRNRTLLPITDGKQSPLGSSDEHEADVSLLLVPMLARGEALGVLVIEAEKGFEWASDQQAAMQHLANQVATALRLLEQQSVREQLFRSEKLAAAGKLVLGVAGELRAPLRAIEARAREMIGSGDSDREVRAIAEDAARASSLVERLVSFAEPGSQVVEPVELNELLRGLEDFRQQEWRVRGVHCRFTSTAEQVVVAGSWSQLQQAFLNLLLHAEQCVAGIASAAVEVETSVLGKRALVRIRYAGAGADKPGTDPLQVVHGIMLSHGGELHPASEGGKQGFDVFLPLVVAGPNGAVDADSTVRSANRRITALIVEPETMGRRELVRMLGERRHRAVPVSNAEEALDLMERMRFEVVMCSVRLPGANWVEFRERCRNRAGTFVLMSEEPPASQILSLRKPVSPGELDALLRRVAGE